MIEIKQVKTQDEVNYTFVEKLMHTAFPQEEIFTISNILLLIPVSETAVMENVYWK